MKLYNTATRQKKEFKPINDKKVGIYSCGPTVYSSPHIGNMYAYVCWDVLVRTLKYLGYDVKHVVNITDVGHLTSDADSGEDKMEKSSIKEMVSVWDIANKYITEFEDNLRLLNIETPSVMPRATDNIKEQISLVKKIEAKGYTYRIGDGIYFDTSKFKDYGKFANLNLEKIKEGARVEVNPEKKNPTDFALWKFSGKSTRRRQMEWFFDGPEEGELVTVDNWRKSGFTDTIGFPGWHIECTAMSVKYLGNPFDIHTGGEDHINVHHTNEIAQAYAAFGHNTADIWMHNAFITFNGSKISKSTGGLYTVKDLVDMGYDPLAFRYLVLSSHYRKGLSFSVENLAVIDLRLKKIRSMISVFREAFEKINYEPSLIDEEYRNKFVGALSDDLATPNALAVVSELLDSNISYEKKYATLLDFDKVLGLELNSIKQNLEEIPEEITKLAEERQKAREENNWVESDRLRELIKDKGYVVEDLKDSCKIRKIK